MFGRVQVLNRAVDLSLRMWLALLEPPLQGGGVLDFHNDAVIPPDERREHVLTYADQAGALKDSKSKKSRQ